MIGNNRNTDYVIGYYVEIRHKNNFISRYLHMKKGTLAVEKGDTVAKGQILGYMGNSGYSNGAHLHFSVYDAKRISQDPLPYLQGKLNFNENYYEEFIKNVQNSLGARADGIAGPKFTRAVKNYQEDNDCVVDGYITKQNKT